MKMDQYIKDIGNFVQKEQETLLEALERLQEIIRSFSHHGFSPQRLVHIFYGGVSSHNWTSLDATCEGNLILKPLTNDLKCRSKDFDFDVLMMPYDCDVLIPYEKALLKFNSRQKSKNTRYNIKKISSDLGRELQIEIAKGLAKKFKLKCLFQEIDSLVIDYQRM